MKLKLIVIPTRIERTAIQRALPSLLRRDDVAVKLCGFGLVAAAARTSSLIERLKPSEVLLLGIAGGFGAHTAVGGAIVASEVVVDGVGVGEAETYQSAGQLGWKHYEADGARSSIGDRIPFGQPGQEPVQLLSVAAASADRRQADARAARFPDAVAEDMETFAVATACQLAEVPLTVIRGISNTTGNRDHAQWKINEAMTAVAEAANRRMS